MKVQLVYIRSSVTFLFFHSSISTNKLVIQLLLLLTFPVHRSCFRLRFMECKCIFRSFSGNVSMYYILINYSINRLATKYYYIYWFEIAYLHIYLWVVKMNVKQMAEKIGELENAALAEKPWQLTGEVSAQTRPENSMLEEDVDFDQASRMGKTSLSLGGNALDIHRSSSWISKTCLMSIIFTFALCKKLHT